eukprot:PhF_6_TR43499/c0_g1_i1/m.66776
MSCSPWESLCAVEDSVYDWIERVNHNPVSSPSFSAKEEGVMFQCLRASQNHYCRNTLTHTGLGGGGTLASSTLPSLSDNCLSATFDSTGRSSLLMASRPYTNACGSRVFDYFEVKVTYGEVAVGVCETGRQRQIISYRSDGMCLCPLTHNSWTPYGPRIQKDDTVGCGIGWNTGEVFFTHNGVKLKSCKFAGCVSLTASVNMENTSFITMNFGAGAEPFVWKNVTAFHVQEEKAFLESINNSISVPRHDMTHLILDYLNRSGFGSTYAVLKKSLNGDGDHVDDDQSSESPFKDPVEGTSSEDSPPPPPPPPPPLSPPPHQLPSSSPELSALHRVREHVMAYARRLSQRDNQRSRERQRSIEEGHTTTTPSPVLPTIPKATTRIIPRHPPAMTLPDRSRYTQMILKGHSGDVAQEMCSSATFQNTLGTSLIELLHAQQFIDHVNNNQLDEALSVVSKQNESRALSHVVGLVAYPDPHTSPLHHVLGLEQKLRVASYVNAAILVEGDNRPTSLLDLGVQHTVSMSNW